MSPAFFYRNSITHFTTSALRRRIVIYVKFNASSHSSFWGSTFCFHVGNTWKII